MSDYGFNYGMICFILGKDPDDVFDTLPTHQRVFLMKILERKNRKGVM